MPPLGVHGPPIFPGNTGRLSASSTRGLIKGGRGPLKGGRGPPPNLMIKNHPLSTRQHWLVFSAAFARGPLRGPRPPPPKM